MPQHDIDELRTLLRDLASAAACVMFEPQAVVLDFQEFFVEREQLRRAFLTLQSKLLFSMREDFFTVTEHGQMTISDCGLQISENGLPINFARAKQSAMFNLKSATSQLDAVTLHFVVKRWSMNPENLCGLLFVAVTLRECF